MAEIIKTPTEARQASKEGVVRYVLVISTTAAILAMAVLLFIAR